VHNQFADPIKEQVWQTLQALNRAWTQGRPEDLVDYFHPNMVAITPTDRLRVEGGEACVAGWKAFADAAKIHYWREMQPDVRVFGDTAVVSYYYDMSFDMGGKTVHAEGRDMFVFVKENGKWWAVADQFSAYPS